MADWTLVIILLAFRLQQHGIVEALNKFPSAATTRNTTNRESRIMKYLYTRQHMMIERVSVSSSVSISKSKSRQTNDGNGNEILSVIVVVVVFSLVILISIIMMLIM